MKGTMSFKRQSLNIVKCMSDLPGTSKLGDLSAESS